MTISTVHKVKDLEFDTVIVMPSESGFPLKKVSSGLSTIDAAEEARIYYVAMSRARNNLYTEWGEREKAWWKCEPFKSKIGIPKDRLTGSLEGEVWISFAGQPQQVQSGLQRYIEVQVCVGDKLTLRGNALTHKAREVGLLAKAKRGLLPAETPLRVANVIRYPYGPSYRKKAPEYFSKLDPQIQRQGWSYCVLVEQG